MITGIDTEKNCDARKIAIIDNKLLHPKVDFAALQKTRLTGQGSID